MFGSRRRRGSSNPPLNGANANPSAATAAASAFLRSQSSNASLSAAAAAAALRSRPTTPISVGDVQTKRMLRRSGSTSSVGSSVGGSSGPTLERRGSSGSMSERTFRDPSPSRPVPSAIDAPPVPAIPQNIQQSNAHRRATSLEAPPARLASPPPNKVNGRGTSLGPGITTTPPRRTGQRMSSMSSAHELTGIERLGSRGTNAPIITSSTNQNMVYDPNTRSFLPLAEILAIEQRIQDAANHPVKKKKRIAPAQATGTHLADGTIGGRPRGTSVDAMESAAQATKLVGQPATISAPAPANVPPPPSIPPTTTTESTVATTPSSTPKKKKKKKVVTVTDSESDGGSYMPNSSDNDSDFHPAKFNTRAGALLAAGPLLAKKPSIVREDWEREEEEALRPSDSHGGLSLDTGTRTISPSPLPRSAAGRGHGRGQASASAAYAQGRQQTRSASQPAPGFSASTATNDDVLGAEGSVRGGRVQSQSPARTAHFVSAPDTLQVKHQPPPRSISPRKSALKHHSNSPRGESPIGDIPGSFGPSKRQSISEASNASDEPPIPRKKAVRVSFDESNVMVGEAAPQTSIDSPIAPSPQQAKRNWFSIGGRGKKKDAAVIEDDEIMKPRPALPSFGSVRERKNTREPVEERQLVKPPEPVEAAESVVQTVVPVDEPTTSAPTSPLFTSPTGKVIEYPTGHSNDHLVGAILSQDTASKNAANISKSREPLPPQVTSVEGSGYQSDSDSTISALANSDVGMNGATETLPDVKTEKSQVDKTDEYPEAEPITPPKPNSEVPQINISHPTPTLESTDERKEWPDMPGGWEGSSTTDSGSQIDEIAPAFVEHHATDLSPAAIGIAEPFEGPQLGSLVVGEIAAENHIRDSTIYEETEDESIYSDAAEDLSDVEGDGFMSLDAVVESPVTKSSVPGLAISTPPDSPTARSTKEWAYEKDQPARKSSAPDTDDSWGKAQDYWRGLSADKKHQLEQEARGDAEDSDSTIEPKPAPKPKKKKKKVAVEPIPADVIPVKQTDPVRHERTYMIQPGSKVQQDGYTPVMRSSMRQEPPNSAPETHIRKSMRGQGSMRGSLRESERPDPRGALQKKNRPVSLPTSDIKSDPAAVNMHIRALSAASSAAANRKMITPNPTGPTLRRKNSGDSDSSFKRTRPAGNSHFRSSMRRGSDDHTANGRQLSPMQSSRFSLRSLSPTGSTGGRRPFGAAQPLSQTHMRSSLRGSYDSAPTLRGSRPERAKSPIRIPGFGRSSSTKPAKQRPIPQRSSRFADSSDEEDVRPAFRSRFVDSSDDDDEPPLPKIGGMRGSMRANQPVRGIPRRAGVDDGDSSDLPDSDDEKSPISPGIKLSKNRPNGTTNTTQGLTLASGSLRRSGSGRNTMASPTDLPTSRPKQTHRGSLMSILRRKKVDPSSKVRKSDIESAARRDTPLERSRSDLQAVRRQESYHSTNGERPTSPKLQKRNNSASWPLPATDTPKILGSQDDRPSTADAGLGLTNGDTESMRPELGSRRFTATGLGAVDLSTVTGKGRKKKKFQALRKMFRLDD